MRDLAVERVKRFLWKEDTTWQEIIVIAAIIALVIALIGVAR